jgi:cell division protein FtsL
VTPAAATARKASARAAPARRPARRRAPSRRAPSRRAPRRAPAAQIIPGVAARTAGAVGDLADSGVMVRLTRGRLWIAVLAALLAGIVALNVLSLSLTSESGRLTERSEQLAQDNSVLRAKLARQLSSARVESIAASLGLAVPDPREIVYLSPDGDDPKVAAQRIESGELGTGTDLAASTAAPETTTAP